LIQILELWIGTTYR